MKEFKSKPVKGVTDLNDSKYSIRAEQARINGKSEASVKAAKTQGDKNVKNKFWENLTFEQRSKGGIISGNQNVESGHLQSISHLGGNSTALIQSAERKNNVDNILSKLNDTFISKEIKNVCVDLGLSPSYHKTILKDKNLCKMIYKSPKPNQYNPSIYKKL